jgi:ribose 1,5-bisphosphate isomerase
LADAGIDVTLIVDSAANFFLDETDLVIIGADTITADGSVINKIGTSQIALCATEKNVPVYVCAETYKFSKTSINGKSIRIEERDITEIVEPELLKGVKVRNPVFDITPPKYVKSIITEKGEFPPKDIGDINTGL